MLRRSKPPPLPPLPHQGGGEKKQGLSRRALFLVFLAALLPRVWAMDWGMPLKRGHIDEAVVVFYSLHVAAGDPNPRGFFDYPAFFLYALAALFKTALTAARWTGEAVPAAGDLLDAYTRGDGLVWLLGLARLVNVLLGALTAAVISRFGSERWGRFAGLAAGLLWAVNPLAVRHAHYATVDVPVSFLFFLAVARLAAYWDAGERRDGLWAAFFIGMAAATKYHPGALVLFLLPVPCLKKKWGTAALLAAVAALAFLAASPYSVLEPAAFAGRFSHLFPKIVGGGSHFLLPTLAALFSNAGIPALLASAAGLALFFRSPVRGDKAMAGVAVFTFLFLGSWGAQLPHYALPLYPLLFLAAGRALSSLSVRHRLLPPAALALLLAAVLPRTVETLKTLSTPDTRLRALAWARETLPPGARLLRFAHTAEFTPRDPFAVKVDWENRLLAGGAEALPADDVDVLMYGTYNRADPLPAALAARFPPVATFDDPPPDFPHHPSIYVYRKGKG